MPWYSGAMESSYDLRGLPPDVLLARLQTLLARDHQVTADLLAHLSEVDARKLYLEKACSSMFTYCVERLHMSEPTAYKRIEAARAARDFPVIFERVAAGELGLTAVTLLSPKLTLDNHLELLAAAAHRSKRDLERLLAARFPRPDVATDLRKVPQRRVEPAAPPPPTAPPPDAPPPDAPPPPAVPSAAPPAVAPPAFFLSPPAAPRSELKPLSEDRYYLKLTLSAPVRDKLLEAQALLRHRIPSGDLDAVLGRALDALLRDLRRDKFGETAAPRTPAAPPQEGSRHIPSAVKRAVAERDGYQCSFVDEHGQRCQERALLEYDHVEPFARGGASDTSGVRLLCRAHNAHAAVKALGEDFMRRKLAAARAG